MITRYQLTKADIKKIALMWDEKTVKEIAAEIGCHEQSIYKVGKLMKEAGYRIQYKKTRGSTDGLIRDAIDEL